MALANRSATFSTLIGEGPSLKFPFGDLWRNGFVLLFCTRCRRSFHSSIVSGIQPLSPSIRRISFRYTMLVKASLLLSSSKQRVRYPGQKPWDLQMSVIFSLVVKSAGSLIRWRISWLYPQENKCEWGLGSPSSSIVLVLGGASWDTAKSSQSNLKDSGCRRDSRKDGLRESWGQKSPILMMRKETYNMEMNNQGQCGD